MAPCDAGIVALTKGEPPRLAARFWDEYSGKQMLLDSFFKGAGTKKFLKEQTSSVLPAKLPVAISLVDLRISASQTPSTSVSGDFRSTTLHSSSQKTYSDVVTLKRPRSPSFDLNTHSEASYASSAVTGTQKKKVKISPLSGGKEKREAKAEEVDPTMENVDVDIAGPSEEENQDFLKLPSSQGSISFTSASSGSSETEKSRTNSAGAAWKTLLAKPPAPRCTVHNEEAKEFRVNNEQR